MSELLLPVSSSQHKNSLIFATQLFSFLDGTVFLIDTDLLGNSYHDVYQHKDGKLAEAPMSRDLMVLDEAPVRSEENFSRRMAIDAAMHLEEATGISSAATLERFGLSKAQE